MDGPGDVKYAALAELVQAGETGGFLDLVLAQIADFQSREKELRSKVMAAMLYPCILLGLATCVLLTVPLRVHGQTDAGEKFTVKTLSHSVSLHGASVELEQGVVLGEILHLENEHTKEKAEGKVVSIRRARDGKRYVSVEFTAPDVNFWHMVFPLPGARPMRRPIGSKVSSL